MNHSPTATPRIGTCICTLNCLLAGETTVPPTIEDDRFSLPLLRFSPAKDFADSGLLSGPCVGVLVLRDSWMGDMTFAVVV
jgi:hypothetical protein